MKYSQLRQLIKRLLRQKEIKKSQSNLISLEFEYFGCYTIRHLDGRGKLVQTDWNWPSLAIHFGFTPCYQCNETNGTTNCKHNTTLTMINNAKLFLDQVVKSKQFIIDPGYFK